MSDVATLIADLVAAGTPASLVGRVAAALAAPSQDEELSADRRERDRIRKRISRDKSKPVSTDSPRTVTRTEDIPSPPPAPSPDKEIPRTPLENNLFPEPPPQPRVSGAREFERFWQVFPNKVGKADASKAFVKAISKIQIEPMLEALDRYVHKTDDRPWCNPATWLNQERWTDQPAEAARAGPSRGGGGPRGLEWFDEAARWIDENEQRRTETGNRRDQNAVGRAPQLAIVHRS